MAKDPMKLVTPEFRGSFVWLSKARPGRKRDDGTTDEPKFQLCIVLEKEDSFWAKLAKATKAAAVEKWGKVPNRMKTTVHDGDNQDEDKEKEEFIGCNYVTATSTTRPGVIGPDGEDILDPSELYSGAWYRASIRVGAWSHETGGKGVSVYLENILKVDANGRDDSAFSGKASAASDFADYVDDGDGDDDPAA